MSETRREIPQALQRLLQMDIKFTKTCYDAFDRRFGLLNRKKELKALEISCHGLIWIGGCFAMTYLFPNWLNVWVNLLSYLFLDIIIVACLKAFTRRRRPSFNTPDMFVSISVDKFSFPSGHATRAVGLALLFTFLLPFPPFLLIPIYIWSAAVCTSRVCLGRHHVLDIIGGVIVGIAEIFLMSFLWMDDDTAKNVGNSLFGEDPWSNA